MRAHHPRDRDRERGAVLVEAVIAIAMMVLMLACAWFTHEVYASKLAKLYEARNAAWGGTHPDCENDGRGDPEPARVTAPSSLGALTLEVGAVTEFTCNETPNDFGDLVSVFEWGLGAGDAVWDEIFDLIDALRE
jgi:hypothetical protein